MLYSKLVVVLALLLVAAAEAEQADTDATSSLLAEDELPTVLIAILVRNKQHTLPLFLTYLEQLDYPKNRLALWLRSDHNSDRSISILERWLEQHAELYNSVDYTFDRESPERHQNESSSFDWPLARFEHIIALKEAALRYARKSWADYIFFLDADVLLTHAKTLKHLTKLHLPIVAPMLLSDGLYSNFWCGMTTEYYYERTDEYKEIYESNKAGTFAVRMVHSAVLINLNYEGTRHLTFNREQLIKQQEHTSWPRNAGTQCRPYDGPLDDIIIFAISANCSQIPLFINNEIPFGYLLQPLDPSDDIAADLQQLVNIRVNIVHDLGAVSPITDVLKEYATYPEKHTLTLDHIYMINLERRPERRQKMENLFVELGLQAETFDAVDGKVLSAKLIAEMGIKMLPDYEDPYHHRQMTRGEIGCFLSHYRIWEKIVRLGQREVLILEDDIRFEPYFREHAERVLQQIRSVSDYDLIYFGRKRLKDEKEPWVRGTENVVHVGYSYWTLGYVLTLKGARKLLAAKPLEKLIPVDEFLPVMFDRHPNKTWSTVYRERDLLAFSAAPLLLYPTHYTGEAGYISDTEDSETANNYKTDSNVPTKGDRELEFTVNGGGGGELPSMVAAGKADYLLKHDMGLDKTQHEEL